MSVRSCALFVRSLSALCLAALLTPSFAQTMVSGAMTADARWQLSGSPYVLQGDVVIQGGARLTIDAGVVVSMAAGASLNVEQGSLLVQGSLLDPVKVQSDKRRNGQVAAPGDWKHWRFAAGASSVQLDNITIEHGSGMLVSGASPVLNNVEIRNHLGAAITADLRSSLSGRGNRATGNTLNAVVIPAGDITGNVRWGLRGIPYLLQSGRISVGASPVVSSMVPDRLQQGESITIELGGTRLAGLAGARFDKPGLSAQVLAGGSDVRASLSISADATTETGNAMMTLLTDAGEVQAPVSLMVLVSQPVLSTLAPAALYLGQGTVNLAINGRGLSRESVVLINGEAVATEYVSGSRLAISLATPGAAGTLAVSVRSPDPQNVGQTLVSNALALPVSAPQLSITPASATLVAGRLHAFTLSQPYPAPEGGSLITLVSSVPGVGTVPGSVLIPQAASSAAFELNALGSGNTVITASRNGFASAQASVTLVPPPSLAFSPNSVAIGVGRQTPLSVKASKPAPEGGLSVQLTSSDAAVASVPASVQIPAGQDIASVNVSTHALGSAKISAAASDFVSGIATVSVRPVSLILPGGALVAPGLSRSIPINLSDPAPQGGLLITLQSSDPAIASVPASVSVPAGESKVNFTLSGIAAGTASISASAAGYQSATLPASIEAVVIRVGSVSSLSMPEGYGLSYPVSLSRPAPAGGVVISLAMAEAGIASVSPAEIHIGEGETSGGTVVLRVEGLAKGSTTLLASAEGLSAASLPVTVRSKPVLSFSRASTVVGKGFNTYEAELYIQRRVDGVAFAGSEALTVTLTSSDPSRAAVPAVVTIPAGSSQVSFVVSGIDFTVDSPVAIDASAEGHTAPASKLTARVVAPQFRFLSLDGTRSVGSVRDSFYIWPYVTGSTYPENQTPIQDMSIELSVLDADPAGLVDGIYSTSSGGTALTQTVLKAGTYNTSPNYFSGYSWLYVGTPVAAGSYTLQASVPGVTSTVSAVQTVQAPQLAFNRSSAVVGKGFNTYSTELYLQRTVNGAAFNGTEALTVTLTSSDPSRAAVPATVTIPAGSSQASFVVSGIDFTADSPVTIDASAEGHTAPASKLTARVVAPEFRFVNLDGTRSVGSVRDSFYIWPYVTGSPNPEYQTPIQDMSIDLSVVDADPASLVDGIYSTFSGGAAVTQTVLKAGTYNTSPNYFSGYSWLYMGTPVLAGSYKLQASVAGVASTVSAAQTVLAPQLAFNRSSTVVGKGFNTYSTELYLQRTVNGAAFNGTEALTVTLTSSDPSRAAVPATVTIPAGSSQVSFVVSGIDFTADSPVTIDASADGHTAPASKLTARVVAPQFRFLSLDGMRSVGSVRDSFHIWPYVTGSAYPENQTSIQDMSIELSVLDADPAGLVDGIYSTSSGGTALTQTVLKAGTYNTSPNYFSGYSWLYVGTPVAAGSYKLQASVPGVASTVSAVQTVQRPQLGFSRASVIVGKGLKSHTSEVSVQRVVNGSAFSAVEPLTVSLSCTSTAVCSMPATVTIPANASSVSFQVEGVALGDTVIQATAEGYDSSPDLPVKVITPQLVFSSLGNTSVGNMDDFRVYLNVPGASYPNNQVAAAPVVVNLTSSAPGVGRVPESVTIAVGSTYSPYVQLTGVSPSTTTITASGKDLTSVSSAITINP